MTQLHSFQISRLAALAVLAALVTAPAIHGALSHGHYFCHDDATVEAIPIGAHGDPESEACPVCFASANSRTAIAIALPHPATAGAATQCHTPSQQPSASVDLTLAAPRAPPVTA